MAFTWTDSVLSNNVYSIKSEHLTEIYNAINTLKATIRSNSGTTTDDIVIPELDKINASNIEELRSHISELYTTIITDKTTNDSTNKISHKNNDNGANYSGQQSSVRSSHYGNYQGIDRTTSHRSVYTNHHRTYIGLL